MRTTVDLPPDVHAALLRRARSQGQTMSRALAELLRERLLDRPVVAAVHPATGLPVVDLGRTFTDREVADLLEEP